LRLTKNNSIPPKSNNSKIAKNGEVSPFNLNNKYEITKSPNRNPRRAFKIKPNRKKRDKKRRINAKPKTENLKLKMEN
jgi:hypothetical protein